MPNRVTTSAWGLTQLSVVVWVLSLVTGGVVFAGVPTLVDMQPCHRCRVVGTAPLSEITITFSEPVEYSADDISVRSRVTGGEVGFTLLKLKSPSDQIVIQLDSPAISDMITVVLDYSIASASTGESLDGESPLASPWFPTGDGTGGGQYLGQFAVLQGDVNGDQAVNVADQGLIGINEGMAVTPCTCSAVTQKRFDLDDDGDIDDDDFNIATDAISLFIPQTDGTAPALETIVDGQLICGSLGLLTLEFSEALDPATVTAATLYAVDESGSLFPSLSASLHKGGDAVEYEFDPPLVEGVFYNLTLSESLADPSGALLDRNVFEVITTVPIPPSIVMQMPPEVTVCENTAISAAPVVEGGAPLFYQWFKDGLEIPGETLDTLALSSVQLTDAGIYQVQVYNGCGSVLSEPVTLTVATAPTIQTQPADKSVDQASTVTFAVSAAGTEPLAYQWRKDSVELPGETDDSLTLVNAMPTDEGSYDVVITDALGCATISDPASLEVNPSDGGEGEGEAPSIVVQPMHQATCIGGATGFAVVADGTPPLAYQWEHNGSPISGANSAMLDLNNVMAEAAGSYHVIVSNNAGSVVSEEAQLTLDGDPPTLLNQPGHRNLLVGDLLTWTINVTGSDPLTFQWRHEGVDIPGATSGVYNEDDVALDDSGDYDVVISNDCGSITSMTALVTITERGESDTDGDGIPDCMDVCPDTPPAELADTTGCAPSQIPEGMDSDGDGVMDSGDECPDTQPEVTVDSSGCPVTNDNTAENDNVIEVPPGAGNDNRIDTTTGGGGGRPAACGACGGMGMLGFLGCLLGCLALRGRVRP